MTQPTSPYESQPPSARRLVKSVVIALLGAALILVLVVLPAEYGIDPTGVGGKLGLTALADSGGTRTIQIADVVGGNEKYHEVKVPDVGKPTPLPNPAVHQDEADVPPKTRTLTITLQPDQEKETKLRLQKAKAVVYSWSLDRGQIYVDFHGHDPALGNNDIWVRYKEQDAGKGNNGSLVAPFSGEHGWFWQNYNEFPVVITLTVTGYFDDVVEYGIK
jgi:hypothetical protein